MTVETHGGPRAAPAPPARGRTDVRHPDRYRTASAEHDRFRGLDGLRFIGAMLVMTAHVVGLNRFKPILGDNLIAAFGHLGVALFFSLSGFLLFRPYLAATFDDRPLAGWWWFARRRLLRIVPAYWCALSFLILGNRLGVFPGIVLPAKGDVMGYVWMYLFGQIYMDGGYRYGILAAWTLCVEVGFYLLIPVFARMLRRMVMAGAPEGGPGTVSEEEIRRRRNVMVLFALGLCGVSIAFKIWANIEGINALLWHIWPPAFFDWFALGLLMAVFSEAADRGVQPPRWVTDLADRPLQSWALAIGLFWVGVQTHFYYIPEPSGMARMVRHLTVGLAGAALVLPIAVGARRGGVVQGLVRSRPLVTLGTISYGIYLWHPGWVQRVYEWSVEGHLSPNHGVLLGAVFCLAVACATISYWGLELPILALKDRRPRRRSVADRPTLPPQTSRPLTGDGATEVDSSHV